MENTEREITVILTIEAETARELVAKIKDVAQSFGVELAPRTQMEMPLASPVSNIPPAALVQGGDPVATATAEEAAPKKRGRPKAVAAPVVEAPAAATPAEAPVASVGSPAAVEPKTAAVVGTDIAQTSTQPPTVTREQVLVALQAVNDNKNFETARELLTKHGANKLSELKPEQYGAFVAACQEALK
jgi:hypothetical protein